jgi:eukaryotic-like serine/threonine-protein kinase
VAVYNGHLMLPPDTVLQGRYRVLRQLGQGGMGAVYEAIDERLDTTVALKETLFADERLRKQFEREARLLARMHHPALPRVSDHFPEGGGQFLVMQFIAGDDLAEMIARKRGPFPAEQVLKWADQLLDALDYLHTQDPQIIHRDIKPQNLKLTSRDQIILLDFGLAKGQASEISRVTTSASIFGYTPNYAPLEQIQGLGTDARSDIYALGATLYHLLTGIKPPDALTRAAAIVNGQSDPLKPASEVNESIAPESAAVLERAMAQNREQRYSSAAEMRRALKWSGETTLVADRSEAQTVLLPPATSTGSAATRPDIKTPTAQTGETTAVRAPAVSSSRRVGPWALVIGALVIVCAAFGGFYAYQHRNSAARQTVLSAPTTENNAASSGSPAVTQKSKTPANTPKPNIPEQMQRRESSTARDSRDSDDEKTAKEKQRVAKESERAAREAAANSSKRDSKAKRANSEKDTDEDKATDSEETEVNPPETPRRPRFRGADGVMTVRGADGAIVRSLPNGTTLITRPDGTRVMVTPDGRRRVLQAGGRGRMNRKRIP